MARHSFPYIAGLTAISLACSCAASAPRVHPAAKRSRAITVASPAASPTPAAAPAARPTDPTSVIAEVSPRIPDPPKRNAVQSATIAGSPERLPAPDETAVRRPPSKQTAGSTARRTAQARPSVVRYLGASPGSARGPAARQTTAQRTDWFAPATGVWYVGFPRPDGAQDFFNTRTGQTQFGFRNGAGSQDLLNPSTGTWSFGFRNPDGSNDYLDPNTGAWTFGVSGGR